METNNLTYTLQINYINNSGLQEFLEEHKDKFIKDMSDDEFDDMLQQLMEERKERKRKKQSDMEM